MILTTKGRYAVNAVLYIAKYGKDRAITLSEIADAQNISLSYLEQIFSRLKSSQIVESVRGPGGGYKIISSPSEISIFSITSAVDEEIMITKCGNKPENTCLPESMKCLAHDLWNSLENRILDYLKNITLGHVLVNDSINKNIYLDYNATMPLLPEVKKSIYDALNIQANPSSIHEHGRKAKMIIEDAREKIALSLGIKLGRHDYDICFTATGTEANNLLLHNFEDQTIAISSVEHLSILEPSKKNEKRIVLEVNPQGLVNLEKLQDILVTMPPKSLLSVIFANNETGIIQNIKVITDLAHSYGILVHSDAIQAYGKIPLNIAELGLDFATISSHKIGGAIGAAALVHRSDFHINGQIIGGGQEKGKRAGTENIAAIIGFGKAAEMIEKNLALYNPIRFLRDEMESMIQNICPDAFIFGKNIDRLPNTSMINMPGVDVQTQLIYFDLQGVSVSAGSACSSGRIQNSHVLQNMGFTAEETKGTIRVSLGINTTRTEIEKFVSIWQILYEKANIKVA